MKFSKYFLILLLYFNVINPSISLLQMKDLYSVLKVEKNFFSPIYGLILSETSYLKNLYKFGDETSPIVKLVKELFFIHHDQVTFDRTYNPFKPAAFFTPEIIGQLVGHIENYKQDSSEENKEAIKQIINSLVFEGINTEDIDSDMYKNIKIKHSAYNEIDKFTKNIIERLEKEEEALGSSIGRLEEKLKTGLQGTKQEKQQQREKINKEIRVLEPKLQSAREKLETQRKILSNHEKIKKYLRDNINQLIDSIISSIEQENITVFENHTIFLFLTFLWEIASTKEDFVKYFESLRNTLQEKSIFKNPDFLTQGKKVFLSSAYTKEDYSSLIEKSYQLNFDNFEELIFLALGLNLYENPFPKHINMKGKVNYKGEIFPDCGETALLNFFNTLLFDPDSGNFDVNILKELGAKQSIIDFYEQYKNNSLIADTLEFHNDWAEVVSGLPNIKYKQEICEIRAGLEDERGLNNFLNVIKALIFPNENIPTKLVLEQLKMKLEEIKAPIKFDEITINKTKNSASVSINFLNKARKPAKLLLEIISNHFVLSLVNTNYKLIKLINILASQIHQTTIQQFMMLTSLIVSNFQSLQYINSLWLYLKKFHLLILDYYELFLFFSPLLTDHLKIYLITNTLKNNCLENFNNQEKSTFLKKLYFSIAHDNYIQTEFWENIFSCDISQNTLNNLYNPNKLSPTQQVGLINGLVKKNKKDLFNLFAQNIFNNAPENQKTEIIRLIVNSDIQNNFISFVNKNIDKINNPTNKAILINNILVMEKKELFPYIEKNLTKLNKATKLMKNAIIDRILTDSRSQFYSFVETYLPYIQNIYDLQNILEKILKSKEKTEKFKKPLFRLINSAKLQEKAVIIASIINGNPEAMEKEGLYKWAIDNINSIISQTNKINILHSILNANPFIMKKEGFYDWIQKNRNCFPDQEKAKIDSLLEKN